ncbi:hypothetical protein [Streptomyces sp. NPDC052042]|uniref:hypothetical protein n=1 Tax=Streptomyces sp. NPDC052042 TaxID=3365683 RepID=UPI0037D5D597
MRRTVIHGGLAVTASDEIHAGVLIEDGRIAALTAHDSAATGSWSTDRRIDATGRGRGVAPAPAGGGVVDGRREGNSGK